MQTILALLILLIVPFCVYLFVFRSKYFADILASFIIGEFILIIVTLVLSLFHLYYGYLVLIISIVVAFLVSKFIKSRPGSKVTKESVIIAVLFAIFIYITQKLTSLMMAGDSLGKYLPWGRIISQQHYIPTVFTEKLSYYFIHYPPLLSTKFSLIFSTLGSYSDAAVITVPIFFSALTLFVLINWAKELKSNLTYLFVIISLVTSYSYLLLFCTALTEPLLLFFTTSSFYFLYKYFKTENDFSLYLLIISLSLTVLTKYTALLLSFLIFIVLMIKSKEKLKIIWLYALFNIPIAFWLVRNYIYFNNPIFPLFTQYFSGKWNTMAQSFPGISATQKRGYVIFVKDLFLQFPAFIFALIYLIKKRKDFFTWFIFVSFVISIIFVSLHQDKLWVRYQYHFFGILALFSAIVLADIYDKLFNFLRSKKEIFIKVIAILLIISVAFAFYVKFNNSAKDNYQFEALQYIKEPRQNILSQESLILIWYGNHNIVKPKVNFFYLADNKPIIEYEHLDADYYYNMFKKLDITYVYDSSESVKSGYIDVSYDPDIYAKYTNNNMTNNVYNAIENDTRFTLIFEKGKDRLWKVN